MPTQAHYPYNPERTPRERGYKHYSHKSTDSGVVHDSAHASGDEQLSTTTALTEALRDAKIRARNLERKLEASEAEVNAKQREFVQRDQMFRSRYEAIEARNEVLTDDNERLTKEKAAVAQKCTTLETKVTELEAENEDLAATNEGLEAKVRKLEKKLAAALAAAAAAASDGYESQTPIREKKAKSKPSSSSSSSRSDEKSTSSSSSRAKDKSSSSSRSEVKSSSSRNVEPSSVRRSESKRKSTTVAKKDPLAERFERATVKGAAQQEEYDGDNGTYVEPWGPTSPRRRRESSAAPTQLFASMAVANHRDTTAYSDVSRGSRTDSNGYTRPQTSTLRTDNTVPTPPVRVPFPFAA
ncbi:unnamed protein product [Parascedosporium putredinis]|uniref:Uncharacterized protein n=1 Tax=Parascedosporium putredinis TaxID=1442378 RepID=A0A9P1M780_9PEZI|nr:unnamed protein product [Parascedosporium putredinis]CAI7987911.1 unnamed protein product [Parascedosporium putredinis]